MVETPCAIVVHTFVTKYQPIRDHFQQKRAFAVIGEWLVRAEMAGTHDHFCDYAICSVTIANHKSSSRGQHKVQISDESRAARGQPSRSEPQKG